MPDHSSASEIGFVSRDRVVLTVQGLLRRAQGEGLTDAQLEGMSGVPARAIKSYRVEGKEPPLSVALSLASALGEPAINTVLAMIGYAAKPIDGGDEFDPHAAVAAALGHFAVIASAAADGRIDHTEVPACRDAADGIIATVLPLSSAGRA